MRHIINEQSDRIVELGSIIIILRGIGVGVGDSGLSYPVLSSFSQNPATLLREGM